MTTHAYIKTRDCAFAMAYMHANRCWATWREDRGVQSMVELHRTQGEASERVEARAGFQRLVEGAQ